MDAIRAAAEKARKSSYSLSSIPLDVRNAALESIALALESNSEEITEANAKDMKAAEEMKLPQALIKRLKYSQDKISESVTSIRSIMQQEDVIGKVLSKTELDEGLILDKVSCPIGVIGVVFESRPDALVQISCLCLKSGNAVLLEGGSEAKNTNLILAELIQKAIISVDERFDGTVQLLSTREEFQSLLKHDDLIDLIIPRGSNQLVRSIMESTRIPVMGHAAGICHTYVDKDADLKMAAKVCFDAKVQYPAGCNATETLLIHSDIVEKFLPVIAEEYEKAGVEMRGDERVRKIVEMSAASEDDWSEEYNDLVISIKIVDSLREAIDHINRYSSHHTDAIITSSEAAAEEFMDDVDSSSTMWNTSTRFADGYRYGLGAEVGISTNKTHARGPVGLEGLTIYKYKLRGKGQTVAEYSGKDGRKYTHRKLL